MHCLRCLPTGTYRWYGAWSEDWAGPWGPIRRRDLLWPKHLLWNKRYFCAFIVNDWFAAPSFCGRSIYCGINAIFVLNEIVASLSTVDGSSLRRPFARGSLPIPLAPYEEALQRSDLPSAVVLVSFCGRSEYSSVSAKILRERQELALAAPLLDGSGWWRR